MEKQKKGFPFYQNVKKIVNLRFAELNRPKIPEIFSFRHPAWQVLTFALVVIGGISLLQTIWPGDANRIIAISGEQGEVSNPPGLLVESTENPEGSPTAPGSLEQYYPTAYEETQGETVPVMASIPDWATAVQPVNGQLGRGFGFGYDDFFEDYRLHQGITYIAQQGSPVGAVLAGKVGDIFEDELYGKTIKINHGDNWTSLYSQLAAVEVEIGQEVAPGEKLAVLASPTVAKAHNGTHLYFELIHQDEPVDPALYLK